MYFKTQQDRINNNKYTTLVWLISMSMETEGLIQAAFKYFNDIDICSQFIKLFCFRSKGSKDNWEYEVRYWSNNLSSLNEIDNALCWL